jgi:signal transduction histidine kinase
MPVDFSDILHVLAHELRTPVGIAHGYVRLLLEERLPQESDRRRALEQMQKALGRLTELSHESSRLATWYERDGANDLVVAAVDLLERVEQAGFEHPVDVDASAVPTGAAIRTGDADLLVKAIASVVHATARELRGQPCLAVASTDADCLEVLVGPPDRIRTLAAARGTPDAGTIALERGGLGLALVHAALVLDAHGAERWTVADSRQTAGFRLPLEERL